MLCQSITVLCCSLLFTLFHAQVLPMGCTSFKTNLLNHGIFHRLQGNTCSTTAREHFIVMSVGLFLTYFLSFVTDCAAFSAISWILPEALPSRLLGPAMPCSWCHWSWLDLSGSSLQNWENRQVFVLWHFVVVVVISRTHLKIEIFFPWEILLNMISVFKDSKPFSKCHENDINSK